MPETRPLITQCELGMVVTAAHRCAEQAASMHARVQAGHVVEPGPLALSDLPEELIKLALLLVKSHRSESLLPMDLVALCGPELWENESIQMRDCADRDVLRYRDYLAALRQVMKRTLRAKREEFAGGAWRLASVVRLTSLHLSVWSHLWALRMAPVLVTLGREKSKHAIPAHVRAATSAFRRA